MVSDYFSCIVITNCVWNVCSRHIGICILQISFAKNQSTAKLLCQRTYQNKKEDKSKLNFLRARIHESYMHQWVIDNMPVTWCYSVMESNQQFCTTRFPVGCFVTEEGVKHDACYLSVSQSVDGIITEH